jgi:PKD repeat protein
MDDGNTSNQVSPVHTYLSNGPFNVKLKVEDNNGCMNNATSRIVGFNVSDGKELISGSAINVFPNPFQRFN